MLVPHHNDPNREEELKRKEKEPDTFGVTEIKVPAKKETPKK